MMGTRADFYIGSGLTAEWLGSVAWDGYEWAENKASDLMKATTEQEFRDAVAAIAAERGAEDWTSPEMGWPWPWKTSATTDYAYCFENGSVCVYYLGAKYTGKEVKSSFDAEWPDMSAAAKPTLSGPRSGLIVFKT